MPICLATMLSSPPSLCLFYLFSLFVLFLCGCFILYIEKDMCYACLPTTSLHALLPHSLPASSVFLSAGQCVLPHVSLPTYMYYVSLLFSSHLPVPLAFFCMLLSFFSLPTLLCCSLMSLPLCVCHHHTPPHIYAIYALCPCPTFPYEIPFLHALLIHICCASDFPLSLFL